MADSLKTSMFALEFLSMPSRASRVLIREKCYSTHITNFYNYTKNNLYENHLSIFVRGIEHATYCMHSYCS